MIKFLTDEDFNGRIYRGLLRRLPAIDVVRVQDVGLRTLHDSEILDWAANENRVLLTHDVTTMASHAMKRIEKGLVMPGVFEIPQDFPIGETIKELVFIARCSLENEWNNQIIYLPLR